jgi:hypothetical protein
VASAIFLAIALVLRIYFTHDLVLFGAQGMRIGPAAIFTIPPAILFGPVYGGIVMGLFDLLGFLLRPEGTFLPLMTVIMVAGGVLRGFLWLGLRNQSVKKLRIATGIFAVAVIIFAVSSIIMLRVDGIGSEYFEGMTNEEIAAFDTSEMTVMGRFLIQRAQAAQNPQNMLAGVFIDITLIPLSIGGIAIFLLLVDIFSAKWLLKEREDGKPVSIMPLLLTILVSGLFINTMNTILLRQTILAEAWQLLPFVMVWLPRAAETLLSGTIYTFFVAILLEVCKRQKFFQALTADSSLPFRRKNTL